ncbi:hypothetical protein FOA52_002953 [Chlamydomonas sp. UWO 241]|nr:hypothetical protein FOA52_002953 [Chlamydomonas sp. UWO 241]
MALRQLTRGVVSALSRASSIGLSQTGGSGAHGATEMLAHARKLSALAGGIGRQQVGSLGPHPGDCACCARCAARTSADLHARSFWGLGNGNRSASADAKDPKEGDAKAAEASGSSSEGDSTEAAGEEEERATVEELAMAVAEAQASEAKLKEQVQSLTDRLMRSMAEMENVRMRSAREVDTAKRFGAQV